jgi:hypothetical protein
VKIKKNRFSSSSNEVRNRYEFLSHVLPCGFVPFIPEYDPGIDLILYREHDDLLLKVQLKSRFDIRKKYFQRNIWMAFPDDEGTRSKWYLAPHDVLYRRGQELVFSKGRSKGKQIGQHWHKGFSSEYVTEELHRICCDFEVPLLFNNLHADYIANLYESGAMEW